MLARFWRLSSSASHSGNCAGKGGLRRSVGPCEISVGSSMSAARNRAYAAALTPSSSRDSSLCRGVIVTSSISHKKPTSLGVSPGGRGSAILSGVALQYAVQEMCLKWKQQLEDAISRV